MNFWKYAWGGWRVAWAFPIYVYLYMQEEVQCSAFMTHDSHMTHSWPMYQLTFTAHEGSPYVYMAHVLTCPYVHMACWCLMLLFLEILSSYTYIYIYIQHRLFAKHLFVCIINIVLHLLYRKTSLSFVTQVPLCQNVCWPSHARTN